MAEYLLSAKETIALLRERLGEIADVNAALALLQWDQETYMPPKGALARAFQEATLSALSHRLFTSPEMERLLQTRRDAADRLSPDEAKLVSETWYDYQRATRLPEAFVREFAQARSQGFEAWVNARERSDFTFFQSHLEKIVDLLRRKADYLGYIGSPYNALLEEYERGLTVESIQPIFYALAERQSRLIARIMESSRPPDTRWLEQDWDEAAQWDLSLEVIRRLGFDLEAGRQDRSVHPFTTNFDLCDVRITTRISRRDLFAGLMASIHECGHALYEQGIREEDRRTTLGNAISLGIHESQSRLWENMIGRSLPFWNHFTPLWRDRFPGRLDSIRPEQIHAALNRVAPSLIRVEADECTYNLHIILRFEIETALIEGTLSVAEIPSVWNRKMKQYLGIEAPNDAQGCLQDVHWSHGLMGYFPTYALGNLYAAQMFEKILEAVPDLWERVEAGDFSALLEWLRRNVHRQGRRKTAPELMRDLTGSALEPETFLRYLENKYAALYVLE